MSLALRCLRFHMAIIYNERLNNRYNYLKQLQRFYATSSERKLKEIPMSSSISTTSTSKIDDSNEINIKQNKSMESAKLKGEPERSPLTTTAATTTPQKAPTIPCSIHSAKSGEKLKDKASTLMAKATERAAKAKKSSQQVRENVKGYVFTRYFDHVKNYDKVLEKNFPSAMKVYRVFFDGLKEFFNDMKSLLKIQRIIKEKGIQSLNRKELELYMQMPKDMFKMAPTLLFSTLPLVGYAVFPLVFMFPRFLLTSHFWNAEQRRNFKEIEFRERLSYNQSVLRCLQCKLSSVEKHINYQEFNNVLGQLGSGTHPTVQQIINVKDIFAQSPYSLINLTRKHVKCLVKMHGASRSIFKRHSLYEHAYLLHYMDKAINREGGVHNMPLEDISKACYVRGLNPTELSNDEMIEWLRNWIQISTTIEGDHITLFLHLPILLAYNHPNNWRVIYSKKNNKNCK